MQIPFELGDAKKHYREDRNIDLKKVKLEIEPNFNEKSLKINAELTLKSLIEKLKKIKLDAVEMKIFNVLDENKKNLNYDYDGKNLQIILNKEKTKNEEFKVFISYLIKPRKGIYFVFPDENYPNNPYQLWSQGEEEESRYWYPCVDVPEEKIVAETIIKVPKEMIAISNGKLINIIEREKEKIFHWKMDHPFAPYLLSIVVGKFKEIKDEWEGIPIIHYVPEDKMNDAKESYKETKNILKFFSEKLDFKYPFEKYANVAVENFLFGGMENITATTLTSSSIYDDIARIDLTIHHLLVHEIAHSWFGNLITCKEWAHIWLNEGFATYFDCIYTENIKGWDEFIYYLLQKSDSYFEETKNYQRAIVTKIYSYPIELFDAHTYQKGALVLHLLRYELGEEEFWKTIRYYIKKFKYGTVVTEDFRQAIEEVTGRTFEKFFDQWLYNAGHPILKIKPEYENGYVKIKISQEQENIFSFYIDVYIKLREKEILERIPINEKYHTLVFKVEEKPEFIEIDPFGWLLIANIKREDNLENLIKIVKFGPTSISKIRAIRSLANKYDINVVEILKEALLNEKFWGIRAEAAKALSTIKVGESLKALIKAIKDKDSKVRKEIAKALGEFKDKRAIEALIEIIEKGKTYNEKAEALISLGKQRKKEYFGILKKHLNVNSHDEIIKSSAIRGLSEIKEEETLKIIKEHTKYGYHEKVRIAAVDCLGKFLKEKPELFEEYIQFLKDKFFRVKLIAIKRLEELGEEKCIPYLQEIIATEINARVIRKAKEAIYKINEKLKKKIEIKYLREEIEKLRKENEELKTRMFELEKLIRQSK